MTFYCLTTVQMKPFLLTFPKANLYSLLYVSKNTSVQTKKSKTEENQTEGKENSAVNSSILTSIF